MTESGGVPGGYLLHSPAARKMSARMAFAHTLVIAGVIGFVAWRTNQIDTLTIVYLIAMVAWAPVDLVLPAERMSHHAMARLYFIGIGSFFFFAYHLDSPYLLLGAYPESIALADVYWYDKRYLAVHQIGLFGAFVALAVLIGGEHLAVMVLVALPLMVFNVMMIGRNSHRFIQCVLQRRQFQTTVTSLLEALHARDGYTGDHSRETLELAMLVAAELDLDDDAREELADVSLLHDIGKVGIPNSILQKPGALNEEEWEIMRSHPVIGEQILADVPGFEAIARAVRHEHERWDGDGYPDGIAGEQIPLSSRIVLACDAFHAMTSDRPYRKAMPVEEAIAELRENAGSQFDPKVAEALCEAVKDGNRESGSWPKATVTASIVHDISEQANDPGIAMPTAQIAGLTDDEPLEDTDVTARGMAFGWLLTAVAMAGFAVARKDIELLEIGFAAGAGLLAATCWYARRTLLAEPICLIAGISAYAVVPLAAWHFDEPAMFVLVLGPAIALSGFFWRNVFIRAIQIVLVIGEFVILPIVMFGEPGLVFAAVGARAFLGVLLVIGYFFMRLVEMRFERRRFGGTMTSLLLALHARDGYTAKHSDETVDLAMLVAGQLRLGEAERMELKDVAMLHDIGKIGIPDEILNKPGKLSPQEWRVMQQHPEIGEQIVAQVPGFESVARAVRHEHERWDGKGYPDGLRGAEIPLASRIVLACDAYHAMTSDRPYRRSLGERTARVELAANAGSQFDPHVVKALLAVLHGASEAVEPMERIGGISAIG
ncbi:MAG: HD-GYP domain-containing protein [Actinobacteria bacterium]|nr:HD-GYP domain-containing protein [Actinomycetota bacterium]